MRIDNLKLGWSVSLNGDVVATYSTRDEARQHRATMKGATKLLRVPVTLDYAGATTAR